MLNKINDDTYEVTTRKSKICINQPFQFGVCVYQYAKLGVLKWVYDFLFKYFDQDKFEIIQMDTDSVYLAIAGECLEDILVDDEKIKENITRLNISI